MLESDEVMVSVVIVLMFVVFVELIVFVVKLLLAVTSPIHKVITVIISSKDNTLLYFFNISPP